MRYAVIVTFTTIVLGCLSVGMTPSPCEGATQWNVGIQGGSQGIEGFQISIGEYYRVPQQEVIVVHEHGIPEEELPVVFYLAQRAHVSPNVIVDLRLHHMSWMDITLHFGLSPEIYYVPVPTGRHHPHGKAYGYYDKYPRHQWKHIRLRDDDIVNQVNLRFISDHYGYAPDRVMRYRSEGRGFEAINHEVRSEKYGPKPKGKHPGYDHQPMGPQPEKHPGHAPQQNHPGPGQPEKHPKNQDQNHSGHGKGAPQPGHGPDEKWNHN